MFWRLTTVADDFGRFESDPRILLANCFPLRVGVTKIVKVKGWYKELEACCLVTTYVVKGKHLGFFNTWDTYQRRRASQSKHPPPSDDNICCQEMSDSPEESRNRGIEESRNGAVPARPNAFENFYKNYPKKKSKGDAEKAWNTIKPDKDLVLKIMSGLVAAKKSEDWKKENGQYIPYPARWLRAKGWEDEHQALNEIPEGEEWKYE